MEYLVSVTQMVNLFFFWLVKDWGVVPVWMMNLCCLRVEHYSSKTVTLSPECSLRNNRKWCSLSLLSSSFSPWSTDENSWIIRKLLSHYVNVMWHFVSQGHVRFTMICREEGMPWIQGPFQLSSRCHEQIYSIHNLYRTSKHLVSYIPIPISL